MASATHCPYKPRSRPPRCAVTAGSRAAESRPPSAARLRLATAALCALPRPPTFSLSHRPLLSSPSRSSLAPSQPPRDAASLAAVAAAAAAATPTAASADGQPRLCAAASDAAAADPARTARTGQRAHARAIHRRPSGEEQTQSAHERGDRAHTTTRGQCHIRGGDKTGGRAQRTRCCAHVPSVLWCSVVAHGRRSMPAPTALIDRPPSVCWPDSTQTPSALHSRV